MTYQLRHRGDLPYCYIPGIGEKRLMYGFFTTLSPVVSIDKTYFLNPFGLKDPIIINQGHSDKTHVTKDDFRPHRGDCIVVAKKYGGDEGQINPVLLVWVNDEKHKI